MTPNAPSSLSDADLLAAFAKDASESAFSQIADRHAGMVLAVCRSVLRNAADAEDAAQAVFLTLARKPSLRHACLAGWLHRVAWYISNRAAEARSIRQRHEREASLMKHTSPEIDPVSPELLHAALAKLPEKYRLPLLLHHLEGRTQEETAALLGCRTSAVAMRLNRGRQLLRERMSRGREPVGMSALSAALIPLGPGAASHAFLAAATKAASLAAAHQLATTTLLSGSTLALSKGALNMLFWNKAKLVAATIALVLMTGGAVGTFVALAGPAPRATAATAPANPNSPFLISGTIAALDANSISVTQRGKTIKIATDAATVFRFDGNLVTAADLKLGLPVGVWGTAGKPAVEVRAFTPKPPATQPTTQPATGPGPFLMSGIIAALDATSISVTQRGQTTKIPTNTATVYRLDGNLVTTADLKVGLAVGVYATAGKPAVEVRAFTPKAK